MSKLFAHLIGKLAVHMHYAKYFDLYSLTSVHQPERYKRTQRKAKIPTSIRWNVWARDHFTCHYCGEYGGPLTLDHAIAEYQGGKCNETNLVTACVSCNNKKGPLDYELFKKSKWLRKKKKKVHQHSLTMTPK